MSHERVVELFTEATRKIKVGAPADEATEMGTLVSFKQRDRVKEYIEIGLAEGASLVIGGDAPDDPALAHGAYLLPTIIRCDSPDHPLANKEFLFPYASVIECPQADILHRIGYTLAASVLTQDAGFIADAMACPHVERLNVGLLPTNKLSWDQPHEGNLFTHLYKQRALNLAPSQPVAV